MKIWYKAVCDQHKEMLDIFVNNVATTHHYLLDKDETINIWLQLHYGCYLRLIHLDTDMDECFNNNYQLIKHIESDPHSL
jgi:hypothetical protein